MKKIFRNSFIGIFIFGISNMSFANPTIPNMKVTPHDLRRALNDTEYLPTGTTCWDFAAQRFGVDAWLLFAIAEKESTFRTNIKTKNTNASYDLGLMQINTINFRDFSKAGVYISEDEIRNNSCKNIVAAGYHLRTKINQYGYNLKGIGAYHSATPGLNEKYANDVMKRYNKLVNKYYVNKEPFSFASYRGDGNKSSKNNNVKYNRTYEYTRVSNTNNLYNDYVPENYNPFISNQNYDGMALQKVRR